MDSMHGTGSHASAAVDAGVGVDDALGTLLADGVDRAGILACPTVGAIVGNRMSHGFTSL
jgi:LytS/YehU family sensor histidine kinase